MFDDHTHTNQCYITMDWASLKFRFEALKAVNLKLRYNFERDAMYFDS